MNILYDFNESCMEEKTIVSFAWRGTPFHEMDTLHLKNCINFLKKKYGNFEIEI